MSHFDEASKAGFGLGYEPSEIGVRINYGPTSPTNINFQNELEKLAMESDGFISPQRLHKTDTFVSQINDIIKIKEDEHIDNYPAYRDVRKSSKSITKENVDILNIPEQDMLR